MRQVSEGGSISAPGTPKPLNRFTWNLACFITSTVRPHMQNTVAAANWGWAYGWSALACLAYPEKCGFPFNAPKMCFVGKCVLSGQFAQGVKSSPFLPCFILSSAVLALRVGRFMEDWVKGCMTLEIDGTRWRELQGRLDGVKNDMESYVLISKRCTA